MKFLYKLSLKMKLLLLLSLPLLGLLVFSTMQSYQNYDTYTKMDKIEKLAILSTKISAFVHETQKERGMTAGYIGSKGAKFKDKLPTQRENSNKRYNSLKTYVSSIDFSNYPPEFGEKISKAVNIFENRSTIRNSVDNLTITLPKALNYYTTMNGAFLDEVVSIAKLSDDAEITQELTAYSSFLLSKERAGIERAVGTATLANDKFKKGMRGKLSNLISAQASYMKTFHYYATTKNKDFYANTLKGKSIDEVIRIRAIMLNASEVGGLNTNPTYWFDTITKKIGLLKKVENHLRDNLNITNQKVKDAVVVASTISNLLHETQKERGATAGFIGSKGTKFTTKLPNQRILTNNKIKLVKKSLNKFNTTNYPKSIGLQINDALNRLAKLSQIRSKVSSLSIGAGEAITYYTKMNSSFLDVIKLISRVSTNINESRDLNAFYNFLMSKERAGIERAVGSNTFARNKFLFGMKEKWTKLITEQNSFLVSFRASARTSMIKYYNDTLKGKAVEEVSRMRAIAMNSKTIGGFGVDSAYWFGQITKKINKLKEVDDNLAKVLIQDVSTIKNSAMTSMIVLFTLSILNLILTIVIANGIIHNLEFSLISFKEGLYKFLSYSIRETDEIAHIEVKGTDEFAIMATDINNQIDKVSAIIEEDKNTVEEIDDVMAKIANGFYGYKIIQTGASGEVKRLRDTINTMAIDSKRKFDVINHILDNFGLGNFEYKASTEDLKGMYGDFGSLVNSTLLLGRNISELLAQISNAGKSLNKDTTILSSSSNKLAVSSNKQAASLEETAAAVEQITQNIKQTTHNVSTMSNITDEVTSSASQGEVLASQTTQSMDEINSKVTAINDAITVIDQIAFQTNILSLNAAVEAATAGEAGKGFAVVAQEVRNLASRSADAATEIKSLVESAAKTADKGKKVSDQMIDGYHTLNGKIMQTKEMMDQVLTASKEQEHGIEQINNTINELDHITQQNASSSAQMANLVKEVSDLSKDLNIVASKATIGDEVIHGVCDVELTHKISSLKHEHIVFIDNNFNKLGDYQTWAVESSHNCILGKWMGESENSNAPFTQTQNWEKLKIAHDAVHSNTQEYVDQDSQKATNFELRVIAEYLNQNMEKVFDSLDKVKVDNCIALNRE